MKGSVAPAMRRAFPAVLCLLIAQSGIQLSARGAREEVQDRAEYLSERGIVLPVHEARIDLLLSAFDFQYPEPEGDFGISLYSANRLFPATGGRQLIMIGIQGKRIGREGLPPLDLVLAVDKSGSMAEPDKMEWVKESLEILIGSLRDDDRVCLTSFDDQGRVLLPSSPVGEPGFRDRFRDAVRGIMPEGGSDLTAGLRTALDEAAARMDGPGSGAAPRVFLLTDGWGRAEGLNAVLAEYEKAGIAVSTVGYGQRFDATAVRAITESTGGASRFISNMERMEEVFGSGLGRTTVPLAKDIRITVKIPEGDTFRTWGFGNQVNYYTNTISYTVPVIHSGDYETILIVVDIYEHLRARKPEETTLARLSAVYRDLEGQEHVYDPMELTMRYVVLENPLSGPSDSRVLVASNLLKYSELLRDVGYMGTYGYSYGYGSPHAYFFGTWDVRKQLIDTSTRLSYDGFRDEISVLENYLHILGEHMGLKKSTVSLLISDNELRPLVEDRPLDMHLENLFHELYLSLEAKPPGNVAVADFDVLGGGSGIHSEILDIAIPAYLEEAAGVWLSRLMEAGFRIVERRNLDAVLKEQELSLSDLSDQSNAARVGMFLAADYILTGAVMEMEESVVIFSRIINVETAVIETAAQIIVPKEDIPPELL